MAVKLSILTSLNPPIKIIHRVGICIFSTEQMKKPSKERLNSTSKSLS